MAFARQPYSVAALPPTAPLTSNRHHGHHGGTTSRNTKPEPPQPPEVAEVIHDKANNKRYLRGKFLGKGGFARCYEFTDIDTQAVLAGKTVWKGLLHKKHQKDKMVQEITIHRSLQHEHVVGFQGYFEDEDFVYVLLEMCRNRSLMELHKRRKAVTEVEARYFTIQLIHACVYLHDVKVIHRDLKLGNLFLNDEMQVKVGDFGLATQVQQDGERKKTLCGTPNYIAPEMLRKAGHSYEVDVWAIGCVLFTLLIGKPPFETDSLKDTYSRIRRNEYTIPPRVGTDAREAITRMLAHDPAARPTVRQLLSFSFFTKGFLPVRLPTTCLSMPPKFNSMTDTSRMPLGDASNQGANRAFQNQKPAPSQKQLWNLPEHQTAGEAPPVDLKADEELTSTPKDCYLRSLQSQLESLITSQPAQKFETIEKNGKAASNMAQLDDPAYGPIYWIGKWVDYSDKYGLGYALNDNSVGVLFNDNSKLIVDKHGDQLQYIDRDSSVSPDEFFYKIDSYPGNLEKKVTLLKYFRTYMREHLLQAGEDAAARQADQMQRLPFLRVWFRTRSGIILHLTNGTLQINFFNDHTKLIMCPLMQAVTYIDQDRNFATYPFKVIEESGCSSDLESRLRYAKAMVERLVVNSSTISRSAAQSAKKMSAVAN